MRIYTTIKPTRFEAGSKWAAMNMILTRRGVVAQTWSDTAVGAYANIRRGVGPDYVLGINLEKRRHRMVDGKKVRDTYWIAHYYVFYTDFLKSTGLRVVQKSRNFVLEKARK